MSNVKISQLPAASAFSPAADVAPIVHSGVTQKATLNQIVQAVLPSPGPIGATTPGTAQFSALALIGASGLQKASAGVFTNAIAGTDYLGPTTGSAIQKANGTGGLTNAVSGTDYAPATSGNSILYGSGSGGFSNVTVGSGLSFVGGTLASTSSGGSVTTVSVVTANGFAGTVANASSTPAITLSTSITGLLKGNGTAISAAISGTDYAPATSGSSILYGDGAGGFSNVTIGSNLTFAGGTLSASGSTGVTSVTATTPLASSGGSTPNLTIQQASGSQSGYLSSTDWTTFNSKQPAGTYVTSISIASSNGLAGSSSGGATPTITLSTSVTGLLKGNGTSISAAVSGTDYAPATSGSSILYGNGSGGFSSVTVGSGLSFSTGTLSNSSPMTYPGAGIPNSTGSAWGTSYSTTGSGTVVALATSPSFTTPVLGTPTSGTLSNCTVDGTNSVGFRNIPQVSQSANYTTVLSDSGKHIYHPSTDTNARTFTIDSNANVAYPVGTAITFVNMSSSAVTIAITSDTMYLAATGSTGSRTLAQYGTATALKIASTTWLINGNGLT